MAAATQIPVVAADYQSYTPLLQTTEADDVNGMYITNNGITVFFVNNASMGAVEITVESVPDAAGRGGDACDDLVVSVPAGDVYMFGPFSANGWNQANGTISVLSDTATDVSVYGVQIA